jgi:putative two-component system response regulator
MPDHTGKLVEENLPARVLVVDDEPCVRNLVTRWLSNEGHTCVQAGDARSAQEWLDRDHFALVTLDISMPGGSGLDLLRTIKEACPDTAVVMLTGVEETQTAIEALTRGAYGYLVKPVEQEEFRLQVHRALERRRLLIEKREYTRDLERKVREQTVAIRRAHEETVHRLVTACMYRDEETGAHIKRIGLLSEVVAEALGWPTEDTERIRLAAPMHDLGKIGIPDAILQKPGKLTADEFETMKTHTTIGGEMLADSDSPMFQMAREIALCHHERWDGTGYPAGISGLGIPESARIVAIVDVYDALTHDRVYRPALPAEEAIEMIENGRNRHFDPFLVSVFLGVLPELRRISQDNPDAFSSRKLPLRNRALPALVGGNGQEQDCVWGGDA